MASKARLVLGCGYVGARVARNWHDSGDRVFAVTRSHERALEFRQRGWEPILWDWLDGPMPSAALPEGLDTILISVSHAPVAGLPPTETHVQGLDRLAQWGGDSLNRSRWIYLSTTGVFASEIGGGWVDEDSPVAPTRPGSVAALCGERWLERHIPKGQRVILRPAGIYGPGRVPRWDAVRDAVPLQVDPESHLNLIHVDDLVSVICRVADGQTPSSLYCVSDGHSPTRREYYGAISDMMGWPAPIFASSEANPPATSSPATPSPATPSPAATVAPRRAARSEGNKRVSPRRLSEELQVEFAYPSFREGLRSLLMNLPAPNLPPP